ncbi:type II secretion system protein GspM [Novosphingobium sp.]|uniref:type II secretion system protein GspM n=1 Tax=Novosphingobium sp. TaxID=1874826 RepID=UPI003342B9F1
MRALSPRESRLVAVLLLLAALALVYVAVIQPLFGGFADRADAREALLTRYAANNRTIAAIPRLGRQAAARSRQTARYALIAADRATAADQLRDRMQAAANAVGGEFHGAEDVTAAPAMMAMRVAMRVPAGKLPALIAAVENAPPLLTITGLAVSADDALVSGATSNLDVKFDIAIAFRPAATR